MLGGGGVAGDGGDEALQMRCPVDLICIVCLFHPSGSGPELPGPSAEGALLLGLCAEPVVDARQVVRVVALAPHHGAVVARELGVGGTAVKGAAADAAHVVTRVPRPRRHRVPAGDVDAQPPSRGGGGRLARGCPLRAAGLHRRWCTWLLLLRHRPATRQHGGWTHRRCVNWSGLQSLVTAWTGNRTTEGPLHAYVDTCPTAARAM